MNILHTLDHHKKNILSIAWLTLLLALQSCQKWWDRPFSGKHHNYHTTEQVTPENTNPDPYNYEWSRPSWDQYKDKQLVIDISHHQDNIDSKKQSESPFWFIAKATESEMKYGEGIDDTYQKLSDINSNKPKWAYMFLNRWRDDIEIQCKTFFDQANNLKPGDFRPIIDIEDRKDKDKDANGKDTLDIIESHIMDDINKVQAIAKLNKVIELFQKQYDVYPILYTNKNAYVKFFKGNIPADVPLWIAEYNNQRDESLTEVDMRQYSDNKQPNIYEDGKWENTDMSIILKDERLFMPSSSNQIIYRTIAALAGLLWAGAYRRRKKKWTALTLKDDTTEVLREWFWEIPKEWVAKISQEAKHIWSRLHPHNKKAIAGILLIMLLWVGYGILTKDSKKDHSEHIPEKPKFPNRKPEMGLDRFTIYEWWQTNYTNPYLYEHKDDIIEPRNIDDIKSATNNYIKISEQEFHKYFKDNEIGERQNKAIQWSSEKGKTYREYAYINPETRETAKEIQQEFNKRLKNAWYDKTLTLQINWLSRACDAQSIAWSNATPSFSAHEAWIAIDFWWNGTETTKSDKFTLWYDNNWKWEMVWKEVVIDTANLILNKLLEEYRKEWKLFITPETNAAIHVVFWSFWPTPLEADKSGKKIEHTHHK
jgi:GH25 family lysozyme M1 (1,4-beta-N-acetylmuramidase)